MRHFFRTSFPRPAVIAVAAVMLAAGAGFAAHRAPGPGQPRAAVIRSACTRPAPARTAAQIQDAYQAPAMFARGINGAGTVIAVIIPGTAPGITADLAAYSRASGLPVPDIRVLSDGHVPAASTAGGADWVQEGVLDLEMAHTLAPGAALIYLAFPPDVSDSTGYDQALDWLVTRYRVTVVSYSEGFAETTEPVTRWRAGLQAAARHRVTVVAASGDWGPTMPDPAGSLYPQPVIAWPASDPLVTAVGGTRLLTSPAGRVTSVISAYYDGPRGGEAGGAGLSAVFPRPPWQDSVRAIVGDHRGIADISMDGSPCSPVRAYTGITPPHRQQAGWITLSGTSIAAPLFAGLVADAAQEAGHPLGVLGPALYQLHGTADGILDITRGSDSMPGRPGWAARPGYDLPTGIGTVDQALPFVTALARQVQEPR